MDTRATQICEDCGSPLRPCKCERERGRSVRNSTLRVRSELKAKTFRERFPGDGERYGPIFALVKAEPCYLWTENYYGPGHECCGPGVQDSGFSPLGHTAHHLGKTDEEGLLPTCGQGHDLAKGLGSRTTVKAFRAWLDERGLSIEALGRRYVEEAKMKLKEKEANDGDA